MIVPFFQKAANFYKKTNWIGLINIMGMAVGMMWASLAFLFVQHEFSVDQFHHKIDRLCRLVVAGQTRDENHGPVFRLDVISSRARLLRRYHAVKNVARLMPWRGKIRRHETWIREDRIWFTDPHVFDVLTLPLLRGDPETALQSARSLVLTPDMATRYFGDEDPMGKSLGIHMSTFPALYTFKVTGILKPLPKTSSIKIDFLAHIPFEQLTADQREISGTMSIWAYAMTVVELSRLSDRAVLQRKLSRLSCHDPEKSMGLEHMAFEIHPFKHAYLHPKATYLGSITDLGVGDEAIRSGDIRRVVLFAVLGAVALVLSMLNFMVLAIADAARRQQPRIRFMGKSLLLSGLSILPALAFTQLLLPFFNELMQSELEIRHLFNWIYVLAMAGTVASCGLLPGVCLSLCRRRPGAGGRPRSLFPRLLSFFAKGLMLAQISACALVFVLALALWDETNAPKMKAFGFNSKNLVFFQADDRNLAHKYPAFKKEIKKIPGVLHVTADNAEPCSLNRLQPLAYYHDEAVVSARTLFVDPSFMETYEIPLKDGEGFSTRWTEMPGFVIISESAARVLHAAGADPLYRAIGLPYVNHFWQHRLQGIMQDFAVGYPSKPVHPLALLPSSHLQYSRNIITIRLADFNQADSLAKIEKSVNRFFPLAFFDYQYLSEKIDGMNNTITKTRRMALAFILGMCLGVAIFGLLGFAVYETNKCGKEMGIRKAFGAGPGQIVMHFIRRYVRRVLLANGIAWIIISLGNQELLKVFEYSHLVHISIRHYLGAVLLTLALALVVAGGQIYRAAHVNPATVLRHEKWN